MSNDSRGYQGNTNEGKGVDVSRLIKENATDAEVLAALRSKYPNDTELVTKLYSEYSEKMSKIKRKAQKFATLILTKYSHLGPKRILEKAKKYKKKYDFSDDEFNAFLNIALSDKSFSSYGAQIPNTNLSRTLGHTVDVPGKMNVKSSELDVLQDILRMHQANSALHSQVVIQALTYKDTEECKIVIAKDAKDVFDPRKDNMYSHVHPVVFALFAPKVKDLEDRMLLGSISSVVAARYNGTQFKNLNDWLLYNDLISDPNEVVCGSQKDSTLVDLRNRVKVQTELWKAVKDLRQGRLYAPDATEFLVSLKGCRNSLYDSPDYAFVEDEGSILRRLFSVFSYRPTVVAVKNLAQTSYFSVGAPINTLAMDQVTTVPIINIRTPATYNAQFEPAINLSEALTQPDFYVENKVIVPKQKSIVYSRNVVFFYINRRTYSVEHQKLVNPTMFAYNALPLSISGYESISKNKANLGEVTIGSDRYNLKSAVCVKTQSLEGISAPAVAGYTAPSGPKDFIVGSMAYVNCAGSGFRPGDAFDFGENAYSYATRRNAVVGDVPVLASGGGIMYCPTGFEGLVGPQITPIKAATAADELEIQKTVTVAMYVKTA